MPKACLGFAEQCKDHLLLSERVGDAPVSLGLLATPYKTYNLSENRPSFTHFEVACFGAHPNPTRKRGTELRRLCDDCDHPSLTRRVMKNTANQSLAHASGYEKHRKSRLFLV